jgi:hypothetical protein
MRHFVRLVVAVLVLASQSYVVAQQSTPTTEAEVHAAIKAANPNYTGAVKVYKNDKDGIWGLDISGCKVSTLEPLRGMPLTAIVCADNDIKDLAPLKGMKLLQLVCDNNPITGLSPIFGMPIWRLGIKGTKVTDLTPLEGMKLQEFTFSPANITKGIDIVRNMKTIKFYPTPEQPNKHKDGGPYLQILMSAEKFWKLYDEQHAKGQAGTSRTGDSSQGVVDISKRYKCKKKYDLLYAGEGFSVKDAKGGAYYDLVEKGKGSLPCVGTTVVPDLPGCKNVHILIDPAFGKTTYAGLAFKDACIVDILRDCTVVARAAGVKVTDQDGNNWVSSPVTVDGVLVNAFFLSSASQTTRTEAKSTPRK